MASACPYITIIARRAQPTFHFLPSDFATLAKFLVTVMHLEVHKSELLLCVRFLFPSYRALCLGERKRAVLGTSAELAL